MTLQSARQHVSAPCGQETRQPLVSDVMCVALCRSGYGMWQVRAHYFEEGNVQLQTTKAMTPTALPAEVGASIRAADRR